MRPSTHDYHRKLYEANTTENSCKYGQVCVGFSCSYTNVWTSADYTLWSNLNGVANGKDSYCTDRGWIRNGNLCNMALIPSRSPYFGHPISGYHGWGSRVMGMAMLAPFAITRGMGFQMSQHICAVEDRNVVHCFFQPATWCDATKVRVLAHDTRATCDTIPPSVDSLISGNKNLSSPEAVTAIVATHSTTYFTKDINKLKGPGVAFEISVPYTQCRNSSGTEHSMISYRGNQPNREVNQACSILTGDAKLCIGLYAWRVVASYVLRPQPDVENFIRLNYFSKLPFLSENKSYGAVHIRRTDAIACSHKMNCAPSYSRKVIEPCAFMNQMAVMNNRRKDYYVFVSTDEIDNMLPVLKQCPVTTELKWQLQFFENNPLRGGNRDVIMRLWAEMTILIDAEFVVGTFSSNIDRLVQVLRTQDAASMHSIDGSKWQMH